MAGVKSRFASISESKIVQIKDDSEPENTKKATNSGLKVFKDKWRSHVLQTSVFQFVYRDNYCDQFDLSLNRQQLIFTTTICLITIIFVDWFAWQKTERISHRNRGNRKRRIEVLYLRKKTRQVILQQGNTHLNSSGHRQAPSQRAKQQAFLDNFEDFRKLCLISYRFPGRLSIKVPDLNCVKGPFWRRFYRRLCICHVKRICK